MTGALVCMGAPQNTHWNSWNMRNAVVVVQGNRARLCRPCSPGWSHMKNFKRSSARIAAYTLSTCASIGSRQSDCRSMRWQGKPRCQKFEYGQQTGRAWSPFSTVTGPTVTETYLPALLGRRDTLSSCTWPSTPSTALRMDAAKPSPPTPIAVPRVQTSVSPPLALQSSDAD